MRRIHNDHTSGGKPERSLIKAPALNAQVDAIMSPWNLAQIKYTPVGAYYVHVPGLATDAAMPDVSKSPAYYTSRDGA
jgi:hypothetical protein